MQQWQPECADALASLPGCALDPDNLEAKARSLAMLLVLARINQNPRAKKTRKRDGRKEELRKLAKSATQLAILLNELPGDALAAVTGEGMRHPLRMRDDLCELAERAETFVATAKPQQPIKGAPERPVAAEIADRAADAFAAATGKEPTITSRGLGDGTNQRFGGPFVDFVARLFAIGEIEGSGESQAKQAVDRRKAGAPTSRNLGLMIVSRRKSQSGPI
jgi:hypothetical protein